VAAAVVVIEMTFARMTSSSTNQSTAIQNLRGFIMYARTFLLGVVVTFVCFMATHVTALEGLIRPRCPHCQSDAGVCHKEVVTHRCRMVEEKKPIKKTVYECKEVPYCETKLPRFLAPNCCPECSDCVKYKKVLVKREITCGETTKMKCVVEEVVHKVPCCIQCQQALAPLPQDEMIGATASQVEPVHVEIVR
jgi:hypothetical protein